MKIDRLLAIVMFLLNREVVSARKLADEFEVSTRTIQRDIDTLCMAGIPIASTQGSKGGFKIIKSYKLDRQLVNTNDLFFILTALESISSTFKNKEISSTLEKIKSLTTDRQSAEFNKLRDKLFIDFSALNIGENSSEVFYLLEKAISNKRLIEFKYTSSKYETLSRVVEPMTIVFKWFSWYLYGFCRMRNDFRLFRLSRMRNIRLGENSFQVRSKSFKEFISQPDSLENKKMISFTLKFDASLKVLIEDYFKDFDVSVASDDGSIIVKISCPEDEWIYSMILGYGDKVKVIEPEWLKDLILEKAKNILEKYQ